MRCITRLRKNDSYTTQGITSTERTNSFWQEGRIDPKVEVLWKFEGQRSCYGISSKETNATRWCVRTCYVQKESLKITDPSSEQEENTTRIIQFKGGTFIQKGIFKSSNFFNQSFIVKEKNSYWRRHRISRNETIYTPQDFYRVRIKFSQHRQIDCRQ